MAILAKMPEFLISLNSLRIMVTIHLVFTNLRIKALQGDPFSCVTVQIVLTG